MEGTNPLDAELIAIALAWCRPLVGVAIGLAAAGLAAEMLERAGRARRTSALLRSVTPRVVRRLAALAFVAVPVVQPTTDAPTPIRDWLADTTTTSTTTSNTTNTTATTGTTTPAPAVAPPAIDRAEPGTAPQPPITAPPPRAPADRHIVRPGDCLWTIAAEQLPADASNLAIDSAWREVYAANSAAIGANPNLIMVGLVLELPPLGTN